MHKIKFYKQTYQYRLVQNISNIERLKNFFAQLSKLNMCLCFGPPILGKGQKTIP